MSIKAEAWNVVIVGFWNRAIYTPAGISRRLFQLPPTVPAQVLIPIDLPAPYQVQHEEMTVIVSGDRLTVQPARANYERIVAAMEIGRRALDDLPRTPFLAAGINLRYKSDGPVAALEEITANPWDNRLSDEGFAIQERTVSRTIRRENGRINMTVAQKEDLTFFLALNFDLQSDDVQQLRAWIDVPKDEMQREVEQILNSMGLRQEEVAHD